MSLQHGDGQGFSEPASSTCLHEEDSGGEQTKPETSGGFGKNGGRIRLLLGIVKEKTEVGLFSTFSMVLVLR
jgi:hypothetical protein